MKYLADPTLLEDIDHTEWSRNWSEKTATLVDPQLNTEIRAALDSDDRIPYVQRRGEFLYNFWRDANHPRGLWRRTTLEQYRGEPQWEILLDVDQLADEENENWVWSSALVRRECDRALIQLSRGGADATVVREFDLHTQTFVSDGFCLPEAKTSVSWIDVDTILVGSDFGDNTVTRSGYPMTVRRWRRGEDIANAEELYRGTPDDLIVVGWAETDYGNQDIFIHRRQDFYSAQTWYLTNTGLELIAVPDDCDIMMKREFLFVMPKQDFANVPAGGVGAIEFDRFRSGERKFHVLFCPNAETSFDSVKFTRDTVVITALHNVNTIIYQVPFHNWTLPPAPLPLPAGTTAQVIATDPQTREIWINVASFQQPNTLYLFDGTLQQIRQLPALFDATGIETRQHFAVSHDGTKIPYYITGKFTDQPKPTLVYAYGGFEVSLIPGYSPARSLAWLQKGFYYVQANVRGGGEYGPDWHKQVLKGNRHKVFEDHQAVLMDLVARGYATSKQLGIWGGSNGGLLMAVALTRYPELFGAAVVQVPLCDMLRYHLWSAGSSWIAEYGDPEVPEERDYLASYSPLANVDKRAERAYPPALVTTSTRDDRVHPAHARLFANALLGAGQPVDYYENTEGGHAGAADNAQVAFMEALIYSWLYQQLD